MIFKNIQKHQVYKNWHATEETSQTTWHINNDLNLSYILKQTLAFTITPLWLKGSGKNRISCGHMWMTIQEDCGDMKPPF